jgi:hypothetical protein
MKEKEFYREEIMKIIGGINRSDVLEYLYIFITGKLKGVDLNGKASKDRNQAE